MPLKRDYVSTHCHFVGKNNCQTIDISQKAGMINNSKSAYRCF